MAVIRLYFYRPPAAELGGWLDTIFTIGGAAAGPAANAGGVPLPWAQAIGAAAQTGAALFAANQANGPARGTQAITDFGTQVVSALEQLLSSLHQGQADLLSIKAQAGRIRALLDNSAYVVQAQRGDDAAALQNARQQADSLVSQINALADQYLTSSSTGTPPAAQAGIPPVSGAAANPSASPDLLILGYPWQTVALIAGGGLLAYQFLK